MTDLRHRVERLEHAATSSTQSGATANDLANFPGMMNLVAGSGVSFTPGTGTLTITATGGGGTVTSVGMSVPSFLSVSGSPVTGSGTLAVTYSGTALPIANGGSGQTTANAALNAFLPSQATHSGKVLQTDGTNTSWQNWIGANNGIGYGSSFVGISADATWFDSGASVSLTAGTYLVTMTLHASMATIAGGGTITGRLYNVTSAAAVTDSEVQVITTNVTGTYRATGTLSMIITVGSTNTIRVEAQRVAGATYVGAGTRIRSDSTGRTCITYVRIA